MKKYSKYKKFRYDWLPSIPDHWQENSLRAFLSLADERKEGRTDLELLSVYREYGVIPKSSRDDNKNVESENTEKYKVVHKNDLVINKMKLWQGSLGVSDYKGFVSPAYIVAHNSFVGNMRFLNMLLRSPLFKTYYNRISYGIRVGQWDSDFYDFRQLIIPVPPREEQDQIVRYLDWQISKINKLIHGYQRQIKLLEERKNTIINQVVFHGVRKDVQHKDSGIEYIGAVPEHWVILQNHRIYKSMGRKFQGQETVLSLSQKDGLIPYEQMSERSLHTASYDNWQLVMPNDLVLNRFKAHLGVFFASDYRGISTFHYGVYEPKMSLFSKYYEALYHTPVYRRVYAGQSKGMTVGLQNLSDIDFYTVYTLYPPINEQMEIVEYIQKLENQFGRAKVDIEKQIELLKEFRTRLISDVVTGQKDVRDVVIPEYESDTDMDSMDEDADPNDMESEESSDE